MTLHTIRLTENQVHELLYFFAAPSVMNILKSWAPERKDDLARTVAALALLPVSGSGSGPSLIDSLPAWALIALAAAGLTAQPASETNDRPAAAPKGPAKRVRMTAALRKKISEGVKRAQAARARTGAPKAGARAPEGKAKPHPNRTRHDRRNARAAAADTDLSSPELEREVFGERASRD